MAPLSARVQRPAPASFRPVLRPAVVPRLSVILVNYRQWPDTLRVVRQLRRMGAHREGEAEIVIVDNHSLPCQQMARLRNWSGVSLRRWARNRGFARAVNEGCRLASGEWLLLLNPDTSLPADFLDEILQRADDLAQTDPKTGIVGFQLLDDDGASQLSSGPFPSLANTLARLALPRHRRKYRTVTDRGPVPWVTGCCLLIRRECLLELGGLDEAFFLYYEDVDLCQRAWRAGWSVWYEPGVQVVHHQPLHRREVPAHLRVFTRHALLTYGAKHWPRWQQRVLAGVVRIEAGLRRLHAAWNGCKHAAAHFRDLGRIAADLAAGRSRQARRLLEGVVRQQESQRGR